MTWYLYKHSISGAAELTEFPAVPVPEIEFIGQFENPPNVIGMEFGPDNRLRPIVPKYASDRMASYPKIGDQLDALWKELGPNLKTEEAKAMYEKIKKIKEEFEPEPMRMNMANPIRSQPHPRMPILEKLPEIPVGPEPPDHPKEVSNEQDENHSG